jgi:hypothetical protein
MIFPTSGLSVSDLFQLDDLSSAAKNADDKLNFLFEIKRREIHSVANAYRPVHIEQIVTFSGIVTTVVFVGLLGILIYMLGFCYPMNRFLWGDYGARYAILKERRKLIRNIIGIALIVGIIVNLVSAESGSTINRMGRTSSGNAPTKPKSPDETTDLVTKGVQPPGKFTGRLGLLFLLTSSARHNSHTSYREHFKKVSTRACL